MSEIMFDDVRSDASLRDLALSRAIKYMLDPDVARSSDTLANLIAIRSRLFIDCDDVVGSKSWLLRWAKELHSEWSRNIARDILKAYIEYQSPEVNDSRQQLLDLTGIALVPPSLTNKALNWVSEVRGQPSSNINNEERRQSDELLVHWYHIAFAVPFFEFLRVWLENDSEIIEFIDLKQDFDGLLSLDDPQVMAFIEEHDVPDKFRQPSRRSGKWWPHTLQFYYFDENSVVINKRSHMVTFVKQFLENYLQNAALTDGNLTVVPLGSGPVPTEMHREWIKTQAMFLIFSGEKEI
jgi:hypothetical protein